MGTCDLTIRRLLRDIFFVVSRSTNNGDRQDNRSSLHRQGPTMTNDTTNNDSPKYGIRTRANILADLWFFHRATRGSEVSTFRSSSQLMEFNYLGRFSVSFYLSSQKPVEYFTSVSRATVLLTVGRRRQVSRPVMSSHVNVLRRPRPFYDRRFQVSQSYPCRVSRDRTPFGWVSPSSDGDSCAFG